MLENRCYNVSIRLKTIQEPTHILNDSSSYIDLIFTFQLNLVMESGVHSSLYQNCHHQLKYAEINLKVFYPPPYGREIWHYQRANVDLIQRVNEQISRKKSFRNLDINEVVFIFNKTIKNIISNFIPHKTVTCDDRDPPWVNNNIKQLIQEENNAYRSYILNDKNLQIFHRVKYLHKMLKKLTEHSQEKYHSHTYIKKNYGFDDKSKNLLVISKNIVKQKNSLYSSFTSK